MKTDFKKLLPHLYVILFFIAICAIYFSPVIEGKVLKQHDIEQWEGMSKEIQDFREKNDSEPLWTRSMFGGMPAYQISVLYPANLVSYVNEVLMLWMPAPFSYIFLALVGFYILLLCLKIDYRIAVAGAIGYAFASYNFIIIMAGHNSKMHAIALVPFVVAGVVLVFNRRYWLGGALTALALALEIYSNHLQITYYLALAIGILVLVEFIKNIRNKELPHFFKSAAILLAAVVLSVLPNITSLWATYEYGKYSTRGPSELSEKKESDGLDKDYALAWSYGISETMTLLIPDFMGGASSSELGKNSATYKALMDNGAGAQANQFIKNVPLYWGTQSFTSGPVYFGAIIIFLFVLGIFLVKSEYRWWLVAGTIFFIMLSWGKNFQAFTDIFFNSLPGYNKFRTVSMILTMAGFCVALLAIMGLSSFLRDALDAKQKQKALLWSLYITGGICLLFGLMPGLFFDFTADVDENFKQYDWLVSAIRDDRESALRVDALRSLFFILAAAALLWMVFKNKMQFAYGVLGLSALILVDMWTVNKRYLNSDNFTSSAKAKQAFVPNEANMAIMQDKELGYRVMNTAVSTFNDASTSYFHHSIGGYHGAKLKRYQELIENQISRNNMSVLDMLNTKYIILASQQGGGPVAQQNPGALGAAWFVKNFQMVANADSEITALTGFRPAETAIVDQRYKEQLDGLSINFDSLSTIRLVAYEPNHLTYQTTASTEQLAVLSEIYYDKGWNAYLDGKPVPHFRANYVLRAMRVPAGEHKIEYKFEPEVYRTGERIALAGSIILILLFAGVVYRELKGI
ncbi:MAG: YfhO family protein [Bacteroidota bacterium]|nr:YfhO family protein [Bacteroidota bacterium]